MMRAVTIEQGLSKTSPARLIRQAVFMEEQGFQSEFDDIDDFAFHVVIYVDHEPAATGRTFPKDDEPTTYLIGRVAVLPSFRRKRLGQAVMQMLEEQAKKMGAQTLSLSAQIQAQGFYEKLGYQAVGHSYYDEHCLHINMVKKIH